MPVLSRLFGRRRGWLLLSQFLLIAAIVLLGACDPSVSPLFVAVGALLVATASATQDIVVDAFRVESLDESEQAAGMASYVAAYRIGMLVSTAGALFLVSGFESLFGLARHAAWSAGYAVMAVLVVDRHCDHARRDRAGKIGRRQRGACAGKYAATRLLKPRSARFPNF